MKSLIIAGVLALFLVWLFAHALKLREIDECLYWKEAGYDLSVSKNMTEQCNYLEIQ